mgnify:CR=1 FL=1
MDFKKFMNQTIVCVVICSQLLSSSIWALGPLLEEEINLSARLSVSGRNQWTLYVEDVTPREEIKNKVEEEQGYNLNIPFSLDADVFGTDHQISTLNQNLSHSFWRTGYRIEKDESRSLFFLLDSKDKYFGFLMRPKTAIRRVELIGNAPNLSLNLELPEIGLLLSGTNITTVLGALEVNKSKDIRNEGKIALIKKEPFNKRNSFPGLLLRSSGWFNQGKNSFLGAAAGIDIKTNNIKNEGSIRTNEGGIALETSTSGNCGHIIDNSQGQIYSRNGPISLLSSYGGILNRGGIISTARSGPVRLISYGQILNERGVISTAGETLFEINRVSRQELNNERGTIIVRGAPLRILAPWVLNNSSGKIIAIPRKNQPPFEAYQSGLSTLFSKVMAFEFGTLKNDQGIISDLGAYSLLPQDLRIPPLRSGTPGLHNRGGLIALSSAHLKMAGDMYNAHGFLDFPEGAKLKFLNYIDIPLGAEEPSKVIVNGKLTWDSHDLTTSGVIHGNDASLTTTNLHSKPGSQITAKNKLVLGDWREELPFGPARFEGGLEAGELVPDRAVMLEGKATIGEINLRSALGGVRAGSSSDVSIDIVHARLEDLEDLRPMHITELFDIELRPEENSVQGPIKSGGRLVLAKPEAIQKDTPLKVSGELTGEKGTSLESTQQLVSMREADFGEKGTTAIQAPFIDLNHSRVRGDQVFLHPTEGPATLENTDVDATNEVQLEGGVCAKNSRFRANRVRGSGDSYNFVRSLVQGEEEVTFTSFKELTVGTDSEFIGKEILLRGCIGEEGRSQVKIYGHVEGNQVKIVTPVLKALVQEIVTHGSGNFWTQTLSNRPTIEGSRSLEIECDEGYMEAAFLRAGDEGLSIAARLLKIVPVGLQSHSAYHSKRHTRTVDAMEYTRSFLESLGNIQITIGEKGRYESIGTIVKAARDTLFTLGEESIRDLRGITDERYVSEERRKKRFLGLFGSKVTHSSNFIKRFLPPEVRAGRDITSQGGSAYYEAPLFDAGRYISERANSLIVRLGWDQIQKQTQTTDSNPLVNEYSFEREYHRIPHAAEFRAGEGIFYDVGDAALELEDRGGVEASLSQPGLLWAIELINHLKDQGKDPKITLESAVHEHEYYSKTTPGWAINLSISLAVAWLTQGLGASLLSKGLSASLLSNLTAIQSAVLESAANAVVTAATRNFVCATLNEEGDLGKGLRQTFNAQGIRHLAMAGFTAGLGCKLSEQFNLSETPQGLIQHLHVGFKDISSEVFTGFLFGENPSRIVLESLQSGASNILGKVFAERIGELYRPDPLRDIRSMSYSTHKILHFLSGGVSGLIADPKHGSRAFFSGGIGASMAEVFMEAFVNPKEVKERLEGIPILYLDESIREEIRLQRRVAHLLSGLLGGFAGNPDIAASRADIAIEHNFIPMLVYGAYAACIGMTAWSGYEVYKAYEEGGAESALKQLGIEVAYTVAGGVFFKVGGKLLKAGQKAYPSVEAAFKSVLESSVPALKKGARIVAQKARLFASKTKRFRLFGKGEKTALSQNPKTNYSHNVANFLRLKAKLGYEEAGILTREGELTGKAIEQSINALSKSGDLTRNAPLFKELIKDGSHINDWAKYSTKHLQFPNGQKFQVHFYKNKITGKINYTHKDFKVKKETKQHFDISLFLEKIRTAPTYDKDPRHIISLHLNDETLRYLGWKLLSKEERCALEMKRKWRP